MISKRSAAAAQTARDPFQFRNVLQCIFALSLLCLAAPVWSDEENITSSHGYSFFGDLKYPADYTHFDYVNPDAPKGGEISVGFVGSLDSMNPYNGKGRAHLFSIYHYESLLGEAPSQAAVPADVTGEYYCLICKSLEYPQSKDWVIFHMRPEATFSDGTPVTAHDVVFSFNLMLEQGLPSYASAVSKLVPKFEALDDHRVKFYFADGVSRRSLVETVGSAPIWSKAWFEQTGTQLSDTWTTVPLGSGPYIMESADLSRRIVLKRREDYWGKDLPFNVGRNNFDRIRLEIFSDAAAAFEGFKAGEFTFRIENESRKWAVAYDFPKVRDGFIVKELVADGAPPSPSGIVFNLASAPFKDKRVREALTLAFNFEWTNESLQSGLFRQRSSFTENSPVMARGVPQGVERELLTSLGDLVPADMLSAEPRMPHTSSAARVFDRRNARKAMKLLDEAGYKVGPDGLRRTPDGQPFKLSFLFSAASSPTGKAVMENFVANVAKLGVDISLDVVDTAQYTKRERDRDYDLVYDGYSTFLAAGGGLAQRFGSEDAAYSLFNPAGLASPLVDAIIDNAMNAETLAGEQAALQALDRALRYELIMIPLWYKPEHWVAYYDQYRHPEAMPPYALGHLDFWWYDAAAHDRLVAAGALR